MCMCVCAWPDRVCALFVRMWHIRIWIYHVHTIYIVSHAPAKLFVCRLLMHALVVCHPGHRPTAQAHWSAPMIDGNGMVIVGRSDGSMYKALPVLPHPASQWLVTSIMPWGVAKTRCFLSLLKLRYTCKDTTSSGSAHMDKYGWEKVINKVIKIYIHWKIWIIYIKIWKIVPMDVQFLSRLLIPGLWSWEWLQRCPIQGGNDC